MQVARSFENVADESEVRVRLPKTFRHRRVEVIVITLDDDDRPVPEPHPSIAGKGRVLGDIFDSQPPEDWEQA
jgi:hypothetical protein